MVNVERIDNGCKVRIAGEMTIYTAAEMKAPLLAPLQDCAELEVDLAQVSEIDTAGLQLLVLAKRESLKQGRRLRLVGHSDAVMEVLDMCGMAGFFGDPVVIPS